MVYPRIYVIRINGDDPRKSTALKLVRLGIAIKISLREAHPKLIVLDPFSEDLLTPGDRGLISRYGVAVLDTSWNLSLNTLRKLFKRVGGTHRILPVLFAGNPINYGIATKLSSVEAIAAALYITGFKDYAKFILSKFKWGHTFLELNRELLEEYSKALSISDVINIQKEVLRRLQAK